MKSKQFAAFDFQDTESAPFCVKAYSRLKFGCDGAARAFGYQLAIRFFEEHSDALLASEGAVVIPSPYNYVKNAATILTEYFVRYLNSFLVNANGKHVDYSIIHRKVSYISDYGFLSKEKRKSLIDGDDFYLNEGFYKDKILIFVDDVIITGTHENKLREILDDKFIDNDCFFLYFARYLGSNAAIEAELNFAAIESLEDYAKLARENNHHVIVRPLKYLLSRTPKELTEFLKKVDKEKICDIYHGCLGEGYYMIPAYQENFGLIKKACE